MSEALVPIESLRLHPAHDRVPPALGDDLANLRKSLADNGQQDPIDITPEGVILDGRTRWTLLGKLGAREARVRVQDIPEGQQVAWIVDRAVARRHLSMQQKRDLNDVLRSLVVEVREHPRTGEEMRIGMSSTQRAETLGVDRDTVRHWDQRSAETDTDPLPTHIQRGGGNPTPLPLRPVKPSEPPREPTRLDRARKAKAREFGAAPPWLKHFTRWARKALPEQRKYLLHIRDEADRALALIDGEKEGGATG